MPIIRDELLTAHLDFGENQLDLSPYATTGLRIVCVGASGTGKTSTGLLIAEQLADQGWVSVIVDPEDEVGPLFNGAVESPEALEESLSRRDQPVLVVDAKDPASFLEYGEVVYRAADQHRKPIFLMIDEGQLYSAAARRKDGLGESTDLLNDLATRGRKRALDLFLTSRSFAGSLNRALFNVKNLTMISAQNDPCAWSALAPQFRGTNIRFADLAALSTSEFFVFGPQGMEKVRMQMPRAMEDVALKAKPVRPVTPSTFSQWDEAMSLISDERLAAITPEVVALLGAVGSLSPHQLASGQRALADERNLRGLDG